MYQAPPSSSSPPPPQRPTVTGGLTRYMSAPGAFLSRAVDSVIGGNNEEFSYQHHQYFSGDSSSVTTESTCKVNSSNDQDLRISGNDQRRRSSFGLNEIAHEAGSLVRQKSSPAGFFNHLLHDNGGFSITRESGGYNSHNGHTPSRLKSQLSFTTGESSLSRISEVSGDGIDGMNSDNNGHQGSSHSYPTGSYGMESWENSIIFSEPPNKKIKSVDGDIYTYNVLETQFSLPQTAFEISTAEKLMNIPEDSVPCKVRAKRGCATHPRSIAERERRIRISGRLKKLQELVPNMDKQTSYADMLDLAVQHIKGLQNEVQKIRKEMENCMCGCKPTL